MRNEPARAFRHADTRSITDRVNVLIRNYNNAPSPAAPQRYVPAGTVLPFAGTAAPTGFLLCYGQALSRTDYADLFAAIGTTHGTGDGSTTFNVPDLRGRVAGGRDDMGGTAANRLTTGGSGIAGTTLGAAGGAETVTLTIAQMPNHNHPMLTRTDLTATGGGAGAFAAGEPNLGQTTQAAGGGAAHNNAQPTLILNHIIAT